MKIRILAILLSCSMLSGCANFGHVKIKNESSSNSSKISSNSASMVRESEAVESSKELVREQGKKYTYGLIYGPTWLYLYTHGENTGIHFLPKRLAVAKIGENDKMFLGGKLPMIGNIKTAQENVEGSEASLDDEDKFQRYLNFDLYQNSDNVLKISFDYLNNIDNRAVAKRAFDDNVQYLAAINANDSKKLPNQSSDLKNLFASEEDDVTDKYQVIEQYYDKDEANGVDENTDSGDDGHTYVTIDSKNKVPITQFNVHIYAKVKVTDVDKDKLRTENDEKTGNSHLEIIPYTLTYDLTSSNKWQLSFQSSGVGSDNRLDTSDSHWIVQKY